jgi:hypothetical protein
MSCPQPGWTDCVLFTPLECPVGGIMNSFDPSVATCDGGGNDEQASSRTVVLSTSGSLEDAENLVATKFSPLMKDYPCVQQKSCVVFDPNVSKMKTFVIKNGPIFCIGPDFETCAKDPSLKTGKPNKAESSWRHPFRSRLEKASELTASSFKLCKLGRLMMVGIKVSGLSLK